MTHSKKDILKLYCGVAAVGVLWAGLSTAATLAHLSLLGSQPLSSLGVNSYTAWIFTATLITSAILFVIYGRFLYSKLRLSFVFLFIFVGSHCGEIVAGIVPYGGHLKIVHTIAAFTWALTIPLSMYILQRSNKLGKLANPAKYFWWAELVATIVGIGGFVGIGKALPLFQLLVALPFHGWVVYSTIYFASNGKELVKDV